MNGLGVLLILPVVWLVGDLLHSVWVRLRRKRFEQTVHRDADGFLPGAHPISAGTGRKGILFVHGFVDLPKVFERWVSFFADTGDFTCRAMRLPGFGDNTCVPTLALWREAIEKELDELRSSCDEVWLAGHSLGGALVLLTALKSPQKIQGLILLAPLVGVSAKRSLFVSPELFYGLSRRLFLSTRMFESPFPRIRRAMDDLRFKYVADCFIPFEEYDALFEAVRILRKAETRPSLPLFAVVPTADSVVDPRVTEAWISDWAGPHEILRPDTGHVIPLDLDWRTFAARAVEFCGKH